MGSDSAQMWIGVEAHITKRPVLRSPSLSQVNQGSSWPEILTHMSRINQILNISQLCSTRPSSHSKNCIAAQHSERQPLQLHPANLLLWQQMVVQSCAAWKQLSMALFLPHSIAENLAQLTFLLPVYAAVFARFPSAVFWCVCMFLLLFVEGTRCDVCLMLFPKYLRFVSKPVYNGIWCISSTCGRWLSGINERLLCEKVGWVALCHLSFSGRRGLLDGSWCWLGHHGSSAQFIQCLSTWADWMRGGTGCRLTDCSRIPALRVCREAAEGWDLTPSYYELLYGFCMVLFKLKCGIGIYCTVGCFKRWFLYIKVKIWISGRALLLRSSLSALGNFLPPERWYMVVQDLFLIWNLENLRCSIVPCPVIRVKTLYRFAMFCLMLGPEKLDLFRSEENFGILFERKWHVDLQAASRNKDGRKPSVLGRWWTENLMILTWTRFYLWYII